MVKRRNVIAYLGAVPFGGGLLAPSANAATHKHGDAHLAFQRVRPSDPAWPDSANWEALNKAVGGHLIKVQPLVGACTNAAAPGDACRAELESLKNPYFVGDQPAGTMTAGWLNAWMTAPSAYAVAARTSADVVAAVNFVREHRLRVVIKGGGHSYQGTSDSADSLLIWMRPMNQITMHDTFVGRGCEGKQAPMPAVSVGAGCIWMHVYDAVTTKGGRYVQGGGCATVGVAGLIQSGGFGSFSKSYGTAAGGLLEAEVVTADGQVLIANKYTNPDLYWGLKGGGGGSLGVVTRITLRTRDLPATFGRAAMTIQAASDAAFRKLIAQFVSFSADHLAANAHWGEVVTFGDDNTLTVGMVFQEMEAAQAEAIWRPFLDLVNATPNDYKFIAAPAIHGRAARDYWNAEVLRTETGRGFADTRPGAPVNNVWFAEENTELGIFMHGFQSVWMPSSLLGKDRQNQLVSALFDASRHFTTALHFNKGLAGASADDIAAARDTAMNPAALDSFALAIIAAGDPAAYKDLIAGQNPGLAVARKDAAATRQAGNALRKVAPNGGSYVSESDYFDVDWQQRFFGANYPRLRAVKKKYDPNGLFFVHHGVGSEEWSADGFIRLA
jgi:FAD/FMN-containing dehydrogenase